MYFSRIIGLGLASLLSSPAVARPRVLEELPETTQTTAFIATEEGKPVVECWELTHMLNEHRMVQKSDGSTGTARAVSLAADGELGSVNIVTYPGRSITWPPGKAGTMHNAFTYQVDINAILLTATFEVTIPTVTGNSSSLSENGSTQSTAAKPDHYIFTPMNGDNWFYFRDDYTGSALAKSADAPPAPFEIRTASATDNQVMFFSFTRVPEHKVLHKGACSFSGVDTPTDSQARRNSDRLQYLSQIPMKMT